MISGLVFIVFTLVFSCSSSFKICTKLNSKRFQSLSFSNSKIPVSFDGHNFRAVSKDETNITNEQKEPTAFDSVASKGLAGVLAIACAEVC